MPLLSHNKLIGLPVYTRNGDHIGKVQGLILELQGQMIAQYRVKHHGVLGTVFAKNTLLVSRDQVVQITEEKMIVEDAVVAVKEGMIKNALRPEMAMPETGGMLQSDTQRE